MAGDFFMTSLVGKTAGNNVTAYILATVQDQRVFNEMNYGGDYIQLGGGNKMNRLQEPPQAAPQRMASLVGETGGGNVTAYMAATSQDPRSSAGWELTGNRRGLPKCNYPPQLGS